MHSKKNEYDKKHISRAVLCERQQGEEWNCPHHGTGYNQRDGGAVQLQAEHRKGALGRKGQPWRETNLALDNIKAQIIKHYQRISDREAYVTAEMVRNAYQGIGCEYETILGAFDHIERKTTPKNADPTRTHLNRELVEFPEGVADRTGAISHRIRTAASGGR